MKNDLSKSVTDKDIQQFIGHFLRLGVLVASIVSIIGGVLYLYNHSMEGIPDYQTFKGEVDSFSTLSGIYDGVLSANPMSIIQIGVLCLIATPILRVALSLFSFILEKDRLYTYITLIVLSVILFSLFSGAKL